MNLHSLNLFFIQIMNFLTLQAKYINFFMRKNLYFFHSQNYFGDKDNLFCIPVLEVILIFNEL